MFVTNQPGTVIFAEIDADPGARNALIAVITVSDQGAQEYFRTRSDAIFCADSRAPGACAAEFHVNEAAGEMGILYPGMYSTRIFGYWLNFPSLSYSIKCNICTKIMCLRRCACGRISRIMLGFANC